MAGSYVPGKDKECCNVSAWVAELADIIRDIAYNKQVMTTSKCKDTYDNKAVIITFEKGDFVLA